MLLLDLLLDVVVVLGLAAWLTFLVLRETGRLGVRRGDGLAYARRRAALQRQDSTTPDDTPVRTR